MNKITDYNLKKSLEVQISEFGITPFQLFKDFHPKKYSSKIVSLNLKNIQDAIEKEEHIEVTLPKVMSDVIQVVPNLNVSNNTETITNTIKLSSKKLRFYNKHFKLESFHYKKITSIDFIDNLILTASDDGFVKVSDLSKIIEMVNLNAINTSSEQGIRETFKDGQVNKFIKKKFQIPNYVSSVSDKSITKVKALNKTLAVTGDCDGMINVYNYQLAKHITGTYAFIEEIHDLYNYDANLLCISKTGSSLIYNLNSDLKVPLSFYKDNDANLVSTDFRFLDQILLSSDVKGVINIKNLKSMNSMTTSIDSEIKYTKFNHVNENEFFVCTEENFLIYDLRKLGVVKTIEYFYNTLDIFNDSHMCILSDRSSIQYYTQSDNFSNVSLAGSFQLESDMISCFQVNELINYKFTNNYGTTCTAIGCESGDLYFSFNSNKQKS